MRQFGLLDSLLPKTRQGILAATLMQPAKLWYASELAKRMGVPHSSLQRELLDLTKSGILKTSRRGRMVFYQANVDSPIFPELRGLILKTAGLIEVLSSALQREASHIRVALVYGSVASRNDDTESDIDLMVIGKVAPTSIAIALRRARELLGRDINPTIYSEAEFARKVSAKDHFLMRVLDEPKLFVIGNTRELEKTAG